MLIDYEVHLRVLSHVHQDHNLILTHSSVLIFSTAHTFSSATMPSVKSLQRPHDRPYLILQRNSKHLTLQIKGRHEVVSFDRIKPTYLDNLLVSEAFHSRTSCALLPPVQSQRQVGFKDPVASFHFL